MVEDIKELKKKYEGLKQKRIEEEEAEILRQKIWRLEHPKMMGFTRVITNTTSKVFKSFKSMSSALKCKKKLDRISTTKKYAWLNLARKPKIKC